MILGFLGKGGSGKSSVATQMALILKKESYTVLAIDADHNMDLAYNLNPENTSVKYFSDSLESLQQAAGLVGNQKYTDIFLTDVAQHFTLTPTSTVIEKYSTVLKNGIRLMAAGPQTDTVLHGQACSHSLTTPLKVLLPLLQLQNNEVVVVDEKAGADGVSTGIVTGIDVGVIICEPSLHSIKAAKQIAELMEFFETPYVFVGNKITSGEDKDFITQELKQEPVVFLTDSNGVKREPSEAEYKWSTEISKIIQVCKELSRNDRLNRTAKKFKRNQAFVTV